MRLLIIPFLFLLVCCGVTPKDKTNSVLESSDRVTRIRQKLIDRDKSTVIVVAHRGDWRNFPENSLEAIDNAVKMGVDVVELDVQMTKDSVIILMHDVTLDRTTTGKGRVSEQEWAYISNLKLRNGCSIKTIHKVPTLEEALLHAKGKVMVNLDKADRYFEQVYKLLEKTGTTKQVIMKGGKSVEDVKLLYGDYLDEVIYMPIVNLDKSNAREQILQFKTDLQPVAFELLFANDSNKLAKDVVSMLEGHSLIWYNTLWDTMAGGHDDDMSLEDPDKGYGYLVDSLGARIIQTDRPQMLLDYLRQRELHN